ncbi:MAG: hypothetical protein EZS28_027480, partial [Streblomastix strix]
YSRIKKISAAGRGLMGLDIANFESELSQIVPAFVKPLSGRLLNLRSFAQAVGYTNTISILVEQIINNPYFKPKHFQAIIALCPLSEKKDLKRDASIIRQNIDSAWFVATKRSFNLDPDSEGQQLPEQRNRWPFPIAITHNCPPLPKLAISKPISPRPAAEIFLILEYLVNNNNNMKLNITNPKQYTLPIWLQHYIQLH